MRVTIKSLVAATGLLLAVQESASAQVFDFSFTGFSRDNLSGTFSFQDTGMPTPVASTSTVDGFALFENVTVNGILYKNSEIDFFTQANAGGFALFAGTTTATMFNGFGFQLYSGTTTNPVFTAEAIPLLSTEFLPPVPGAFTITPATAVSAVPEPGTWVMMLLGSGALAMFGVVKRRKVQPNAMVAA